MFGSKKLKLAEHLFDKLNVAAKIAGASSVEELASQILEREADKILSSTGKKDASPEEVEDIANRLKGLGYIE